MTMYHPSPLTRRLVLLAMLMVSIVSTRTQAADLVIANKDCGFEKIDQESLKSLFLGKKRTLPNGIHANIIIQSPGTVNESFLRDYIGESPSQFQTYWKRLVFTGEGKMPTAVANDVDAIDTVAKDKSALSYIDAGTPHDAVKVITIEP
jgi:hypothetical protein